MSFYWRYNEGRRFSGENTHMRPLGVGIVLVASGGYARSQVYIAGRKHWLNVDTLEVIYEGR